MKTLNTLALSLLLTSVSVSAQQAAETTREINAQTTVTRGHIDNILLRMSERRIDSRFNAKDYWAQNDVFRASVDSAMKEFEETLEKKILGKAGMLMDQYNSIYKSKDFSEEQKKVLLKERLNNIRSQFEALTVDYQAAIKKAYTLIPIAFFSTMLEVPSQPLVLNIRKNTSQQVKVSLIANGKLHSSSVKFSIVEQQDKDVYGFLHIDFPKGKAIYDYYEGKYYLSGGAVVDWKNNHVFQTLPGFSIVKGDRHSFDLKQILTLKDFPDLRIRFFQEEVYPTFKGSCQSVICLGLRASDQSTLLSLLKKNIDRFIVMELADGNKLAIGNLNLDVEDKLAYFSMVDYPVQLPFDI